MDNGDDYGELFCRIIVGKHQVFCFPFLIWLLGIVHIWLWKYPEGQNIVDYSVFTMAL